MEVISEAMNWVFYINDAELGDLEEVWTAATVEK